MQGNSAIDKQNDPKLSLKQSSKTCGGIFHTLYYNIIIERVPEKKATSDFVINYRVPDSFSPIFVWYLLVNSTCKGKNFALRKKNTFVALVHASPQYYYVHRFLYEKR